ncbi:MAG: Phospholipid ABC transporter permease protein MlaE, partial [uncultured Gemmatimonadetes bacterium]
ELVTPLRRRRLGHHWLPGVVRALLPVRAGHAGGTGRRAHLGAAHHHADEAPGGGLAPHRSLPERLHRDRAGAAGVVHLHGGHPAVLRGRAGHQDDDPGAGAGAHGAGPFRPRGRQHRRRDRDDARVRADRRAGDDGLQPHGVPGGAAGAGRAGDGAAAGDLRQRAGDHLGVGHLHERAGDDQRPVHPRVAPLLRLVRHRVLRDQVHLLRAHHHGDGVLPGLQHPGRRRRGGDLHHPRRGAGQHADPGVGRLLGAGAAPV